MKFDTKVIHGGQKVEPQTGAVMPPVFMTSTYAQSSPGVHKGYDYSRAGNPTREALEASLASIENGNFGFAFASGLSAIDTVLKLLTPGDEVIALDDLYGGTFRMFTKIFQKYDIKFNFVDIKDASDVGKHLTDKTRLVWLETPTNPLMKIVDIKSIKEQLKGHPAILGVDNTFATPYLQQPLELGADLVMHSATKYLSGHSDVIAGALVVKDEKLADDIRFQQFAGGAILAPMECFLVLRGIKTLALRMQRHCTNCRKLADFLRLHPKVDHVFYPGIETHPNHDVAAKQMKDFGGMLAFNLESGKKEDSFKILESFKVFTLAESLGGVESLANHPAVMTHASIPAEKRAEIGIGDDLIRLSVGVEDSEDLLQDLDQALMSI